MSEEEKEEQENEATEDAVATEAAESAAENAEAGEEAGETADAKAGSADGDTGESTPDFPDLQQAGGGGPRRQPAELSRFHDVQVTVAAELGRAEVPIRDLLELGEGSVFELDRAVSAPIELYAQGVPLGNGEVVVVDDSFAIRIKEIYPTST